MKPRIAIRPNADRDLDGHYLHLASNSLAVGERFLNAAWEAFRQLARMPALGGLHEFSHPRLVGMRVWQVPGFPKHLIFYREIFDGVEVVRILHASQDIPGIFDRDSG